MLRALKTSGWCISAGLLLISLVACSLTPSAPAYHYRMSVEFDTPLGLRAGSSVIEVRPRLSGEHAANMAVDGEAVPVDLPGGRTIYALLRADTTEDWAGWILLWLVRTPELADANMSDVIRAVASTRALLTLPKRYPSGAGYPLTGEDARPTFVVFGDERRPETVRIVNPDDPAISVGEGVKLRRITLQVTDDPVTRNIVARLPWLMTHRGSLRHAEMDSPFWQRDLERITDVAFIRTGF